MGLPHGRMRIRIRKNYRRARRRHLLLGVCLTISSLLFWIGSDVLTLPNLLSQSQRQTATTGKSYLKNHDGRWNDDRSRRYLVFSLVASSTSDRTKTKTNTPNSPRSYVTAEKNDSVHLVTAASATLASLCTQSIVGGVDVGVEMGVGPSLVTTAVSCIVLHIIVWQCLMILLSACSCRLVHAAMRHCTLLCVANYWVLLCFEL